jgi:ribA/ribD-fused uncharacterized protein
MQTDEFYFFWKHEFGQWTKREIVDLLGRRYNCCEQYMMFHKALLLGDFEVATVIMSEQDPKEQQALGRKARGYRQDVWEANRIRIVYEGNMLKFTQHQDLRKRLLDTFPRLLVEASPSDCVWGVGLSEDNPLILNPRNWRGMNLLGAVLTCVRDEIAD